MKIRAAIFDLGGVVFDSPLHAIARHEAAVGAPAGIVNRVAAQGSAWGQLERGELCMEEFLRAFDAECRAAGAEIRAAEMMARIAECGPRPRMLEAIRRIRAEGLLVAALTNNWANGEPQGAAEEAADAEFRGLFHAFVESSVVGLRKPDPRIYQHLLGLLGIAPGEAVFLDDIGRNLKTARQLGMITIKVETPEQALGDLSRVIGIAL
ncbi:MAG: HAD family phosphatase [Deltaproteobacteria bacterium]|nr:HAD family phosphatase [Deltaproteobacteria bacterium]MDD9854470.1 HAD family phosphatase [Deltaproteobacteria bacterium]